MLVRRFVLPAVTLALFIGVAPAMAVPITFYFGGEVTSVSDPNGTLGGAVQVGDNWSGSYTFESTTPDQWPSDPEHGRYKAATASLSVTVGLLTVNETGTSTWVSVANSTSDSYSIGAFGFESGDMWISELYFDLDDTSGSVFSSDALPLEPPDLSCFSSRRFAIDGTRNGVPGDRFTVSATVAYLTPEPTTALVMLLGGLVLARQARSRRDRL